MARALLLAFALFFCLVSSVASAADPPKIVATGEWSKPVADNRGSAVRGRLVICEKPHSEDRREYPVYVELQDASDSIGGGMQLFCDLGKSDFRPEYKGGLNCELRDKDKRIVKTEPYVFGGAIPRSEWVSLPSDATIRLRASPFGVHRPNAMAITPQLSQLWVIANNDPGEYFLSGTFTIDPATDQKPTGEGHVWRGTLELPAVKVVAKKSK